MNANFQAALAHVLKHEGGYSDHPSDPGGATNFGITHQVLAAYRGVERVSREDVKALTRSEAAAIYRARYWNTCRCDDLPPGLDLLVFDCAVNQGAGRAARFLQQAVQVHADGQIGPATLAAVQAADFVDVCVEFSARRMHGYGLLTKLFPVFGLGWSRRLQRTLAAALAMATQDVRLTA